MQFTGTSSVFLPQVSHFSFCLTGIRVSDTGIINFNFYDTGSGVFSFIFSGGILSAKSPVCTYNTIDANSISGYYQSGVLNYLVNGIFGQENISFTKLNQVTIQANSSNVVCDLSLSSQQINYSLTFNPVYEYYQTLTGTLISDTVFPINPPSLQFLSSNQTLLTNNYNTGLVANSGNNYLLLPDADPSLFEYQNNFYISLPTTFGNIGVNSSSYRGGVLSQSILLLTPSTENVYTQTSLFNGYWSGNQFVYVDNPLNYNLGYKYSNHTYIGISNNSLLSIVFQPLNPIETGVYLSQYITGVNIMASGEYAVPPTAEFSQYYYVTGIQNQLQSFLFSSGCTGTIPVSFTGGSPISGASGILYLKPVLLSGIYNTGIANFMVVSGFFGISSGKGYQQPPNFILGTGGGCYSVPDLSGYQTAQFKFANGLGAVYAQAAGLTGLVQTYFDGTLYYVTGLEITNIGFGYSTGYPPNVSFLRATGDSLGLQPLYDLTGGIVYDLTGGIIYVEGSENDASGLFLYKTTGLYQFDQFWDISFNLGSGNQVLTDYTGYYSGTGIGLYGDGNMGIQINCSGLDNTSAVSGLLTVIISGGSQTITNQQVIYQTRSFNLNTGALLPYSSPVISYFPLTDLSYILNTDPLDSTYQGSYDGGTVDNIITF